MRKLLLFIALLMGAAALQAQHWLGLAMEADMAWQLDRIPLTTAKIGGGTALDLRYQLQVNLLTVETGIGAAYTLNALGIQDTTLQIPMMDNRGKPLTFVGQLKNRQDLSRNLALHIPLLIGVEYRRFYGLAGAKVSVNLLSRTQQTALLRTSGEYDMYYEPLTDMPEHGFHDYQRQETRGSMRVQTDLRVAAEVGMVFNTYRGYTKYRLGAFVEYGVFDVRKSEAKELLTADMSDGMYLTMNHVYSSFYQASSPVNNLLVGLRFSILFYLSPVSSKK